MICARVGCQNETPAPGARGTKPKWCSQRCRKAQYRLPCPQCGAPMTGDKGRGAKAPKLCAKCFQERYRTRNARIIKAWAEGDTATVIAARERINPSNVSSLVQRTRQCDTSVPLHTLAHKDAHGRYELIQRLWNGGVSTKEISRRVRTTNSACLLQTVFYMRRLGYELESRQRTYDYEKIEQLWNSSLSVNEIAQEIGVSERQTLYGLISRMRKRGVRLRNRRQKAAA